MTSREAFEKWAREHGYQSSITGGFDYPLGRALWKAWQAATATAPTWHDAPTCAGLWVADYGVPKVVRINQADVDNFDSTMSEGGRWFGPIPSGVEEQSARLCYCDRMQIGEPGVSCGDCQTRDYKMEQSA